MLFRFFVYGFFGVLLWLWYAVYTVLLHVDCC